MTENLLYELYSCAVFHCKIEQPYPNPRARSCFQKERNYELTTEQTKRKEQNMHIAGSFLFTLLHKRAPTQVLHVQHPGQDAR